MLGYLLKRLIQMTLVLWVVSVIVFLMMSFTGDPVFMVVPIDASDAEIAQARRLLGLDDSLPVQYWKFLTSLLQGDFGRSYVFRQPAMTLILERMPATVELVLVAMALFVLPVFLRNRLYTVPEYLELRFERRTRVVYSVFTLATLLYVPHVTEVLREQPLLFVILKIMERALLPE